MNRLPWALLLCASASLVRPAYAGTITEPEEWAKRVKAAETRGAMGANLFGDSTNYYNGQTTFAVTDIDLPGNNALPVRVGRTITAAEREDDGCAANHLMRV
jgi:hypothetical protein